MSSHGRTIAGAQVPEERSLLFPWRTGRRPLTPHQRNLLWFGATVGSLFVTAVILWARGGAAWGLDAWAYAQVDRVHPYEHAWGTYGAFLYGPPIAQVFGILGHLPWPVFLTAWTGLLVGVYAWMAGRYALVLLGLFPAVILELLNGNIHLLLAASVVLGFRYPWTWSFVLLTKVTPGVGLLWFVFRREWRALLIALGATAAICAVSFLLAPWMWQEWFAMLIVEAGQPMGPKQVPIPLLYRLPAAVLLVWWGARTDRPWTVAVAAWLAIPGMWWYSSVMLVAVLPIRRMRLGSTARPTDPSIDPPGSDPSTAPDHTPGYPTSLTR
ncbi:MAG: DUF2029 domain-containing protein [Chloroflexi bacterium]|nr:DUF2029 domain-containing protein [Chloroflexota bacterium]